MEFRAKNLCMNTIAVPGTLAGLRKVRVIACVMTMAPNVLHHKRSMQTSSLLASASVPCELAKVSSRQA